MTETVVFDLDGTLVDTLPDIEAAANAALATEGRGSLTSEEVRRLIGSGGRVLMKNAFRRDRGTGIGGPGSMQPSPPTSRPMRKRRSPGSVPFPGVHAALEGLSARGMRLAVCTNKPEHLAESVLETFGLAPIFRERGRG